MPPLTRRSTSFRWPGSKAKLAPRILRYLPPSGRTFCDLFAGRGNVTLYGLENGLLDGFDRIVVNDLQTHKFLKAVRDQGSEFRVLKSKSKEEFDRLKALSQEEDVYATLVEPFFTFSGGSWQGGGRNTGGGRRTRKPTNKTYTVRRSCCATLGSQLPPMTGGTV